MGLYKALTWADNTCNQVEVNEKEEKQKTEKKSTKVYALDRPLPLDNKHHRPMPDANAIGPHTQLGTKKGRYEKYPQAREFDKKGRPVRDIDFTHHGYPQNHANPHEHLWLENQTGGTPMRGDAQPLKGWSY